MKSQRPQQPRLWNPIVFKSGNDIRRNICTDWWKEMTPSIMARGFKEAGDMAVESSKDVVGHVDRFFYPIATCYRHYLELQLKNLIFIGRRYLPHFRGEKIQHHDLQQLWGDARKVMTSHWPEGDTGELDDVEKLILEFHHWDSTGQAFRYYKDRRGNVNLAGKSTIIDLDNLASCVDNAYRFLSLCETGLDTELTYEDECNRHWYLSSI